MSDDEYRTHMTLWAMQAAPLIMGHDLRRTSAAAMRLLTNRDVLAIDQDSAGVQGKLVRKAGDVEVWRKDLRDGSVALALFNRGEQAAFVNALPADAGRRAIAAMRDLWSDHVVPAAMRLRVPRHGAVLLRIEGPVERN